MPRMLVMSEDQANALRGETSPLNALDPIQLADSVNYVLPARVLDDIAHLSRRSDMAGLTRRDVADNEIRSSPG